MTIAPECVAKYNELKLGKSIKYIIYKLSDDYKQIVVEETSTDGNWEIFQEKLLNATASHRGKEGKGPRYAVYDFEYELEAGEGTRCVLFAKSLRQGSTDDTAETKLSLSHGLPMRALLFLYAFLALKFCGLCTDISNHSPG